MKFLTSLIGSLIACSVQAQSIGPLSYRGSGCAKNSLSYSLALDEQELVLNYNSFFVRSGPGTGKVFDRKSCALSIPIQVPVGYQMALATESDGKALVRATGKAILNLETFYAGSVGVKNSKVYRAGQYAVSIGDSVNSIAWNGCGVSTNLRINVSAVTQKDAALYLDQLRFKLFFRSCEN